MATTINSSCRSAARSAAIGIAVMVLAASCTTHPTVGLTSDGSHRDATSGVDSAIPSRGSGSGVERPVVDGTQLSSGRPYRITGVLQDIDVVFTGPSMPVYGRTSGHRVALSLDEEGRQTVLSVIPVANPRVFPSPDVVLEDVEDELASVTADAPADILTWIAARPYLSAGPIKNGVNLGGLTGRGFDYVVGELSDRAQACGATSPTRCAATIWASGVVDHVAPGGHGRMVELDAAGQRLLVQITDGAEADELLASLEFELWPAPKQMADTVRLPYFAPGLSQGQHYLIDRVSKGLGLVTTAPTDTVTASQRDELVWFGDPSQPSVRRHYDFVAIDADTAAANSNSTVDPYAIAGPGGIPLWQLQRFLRGMFRLPDDPLIWLVQQPYVEVVRPVRSATVGGVIARVVDVRVAAGTAGIPCPDGAGACAMPFAHASDAFPMVISSEYLTRIVDFRLGDHRVLITADLGTPGETLLNSLCAFEINPDATEPVCRTRSADPAQSDPGHAPASRSGRAISAR
jgi:hypothetical protein